MRPQFGSSPKKAVLTSGDLAIAIAAALASFHVAAPTTLTSKNFVAPSPSLAINLARSCAQVTKASKKAG